MGVRYNKIRGERMKNTEQAKDIENYIQKIEIDEKGKVQVNYKANLRDINIKDFVEFVNNLPDTYEEWDGDGDYLDEEMNLFIALREFLATNLDISRLKSFMGEDNVILLDDARWRNTQLDLDVWYTTHNKDLPF